MNWSESLRYLIDVLFRRNGYRGEISPKPESPNKMHEKPRADILLEDCDINWMGIVWHHSSSKDTEFNNWKAIVKYHTSYRVDYNIVSPEEFKQAEMEKESGRTLVLQKPWSDVGYHGGVEVVGGILTYQPGRSLDITGAHAAVKGVSNKYNKTHIGLCAVGNFDRETPSQELWNFCLAVTRAFMDKYDIDKEDVIGHREVYDSLWVPRQKSCPGKNWDMDRFREEL